MEGKNISINFLLNLIKLTRSIFPIMEKIITKGSLVIKTLDGNDRGLVHAIPPLLHGLNWINDATLEQWLQEQPPQVRNVAGRVVGDIVVEVPDSCRLNGTYRPSVNPGNGVVR